MSKGTVSFRFWENTQTEKNVTIYDNDLAIKTSINEAIFIRRIIYLWKKYKDAGEMFIVPKKFTLPIGMTIHAFRTIVKKWESLNLIETKSKGLPLKKWYKLNEKEVSKYLFKLKFEVIESDKIKVIESDKIYNKSIYKNSNNSSGKATTKCLLNDNKNEGLSFYDKCSKQLYEKICIKRKLKRKANLNTWSNQFRLLHQTDGIKKQRIKKVLSWYMKNINEKYVPQAYSAKSFRDKFLNIENAIERISPKITSKKKIKINKEIKHIIKQLSEKGGWPAGTKSEINEVVSISYKNYKTFLKHHKKIINLKICKRKERKKYEDIIEFSEWLNDTTDILNPPSFLNMWFIQTYSTISKWKNWKGSLHQFIFDIDSNEFNKWGKEIAAKFDDYELWYDYKKLINKLYE